MIYLFIVLTCCPAPYLMNPMTLDISEKREEKKMQTQLSRLLDLHGILMGILMRTLPSCNCVSQRKPSDECEVHPKVWYSFQVENEEKSDLLNMKVELSSGSVDNIDSRIGRVREYVTDVLHLILRKQSKDHSESRKRRPKPDPVVGMCDAAKAATMYEVPGSPVCMSDSDESPPLKKQRVEEVLRTGSMPLMLN